MGMYGRVRDTKPTLVYQNPKGQSLSDIVQVEHDVGIKNFKKIRTCLGMVCLLL